MQDIEAIYGEQIFECPLCGSRKAASYRYRPSRNREHDYQLSCKKCEAAGLSGGALLSAIAAAVGCTGALLDDPERWLGHLAVGPPSSGRSEPLPSQRGLDEWADALQSSGEPLRWLLEERLISRRIVHRARIGWDGRRLIFPMYKRRKLVACKSRVPEAGEQMRAWPGKGREWPLYPQPLKGRVLLVAGVLDALAGRSHGLPATSVTPGAGTWRDEWIEALRGRAVVVCFDNNEGLVARRRTAALRAAGIEARRLNLRRLGLRTPKGDLSDLLKRSGGADRLRRFLYDERGRR